MSKANLDIYSTTQPQVCTGTPGLTPGRTRAHARTPRARTHTRAPTHKQIQLHKRVAFCLDMHNQALKAMRYAENTKAEWESAEERRERLKQEEEMMNSMEEEDDF